MKKELTQEEIAELTKQIHITSDNNMSIPIGLYNRLKELNPENPWDVILWCVSEHMKTAR